MQRTITNYFSAIIPGFLLCLAVTIAALALEWIEHGLFGRAWLESIVLSILLGAVLRSLVKLPVIYNRGIQFSSKLILEIAIVLLGASISAEAVMRAGPALIAGIAGVVILSILMSYCIGRFLHLPHRMSVLIACGNSICGNSAIAATAPVIGASSDDVASSIAFTAVLGVVVVLCLPLLVPLLNMSFAQYGILAGLTVYAVPQVLAATAPVSSLSVQIGALVKLVRVLMLGPVIVSLGVISAGSSGVRPKLSQMVPWFIVGFLAMIVLRGFSLIPQFALAPLHTASTVLTVIAMAGLGLGVDVRSVMKSGGRVILAAILSLLALGSVSMALIILLGVI